MAADTAQALNTGGSSQRPRHVAIIMDGNGRWATDRGWPRLVGHRRGAERVKQIVRACPDLGVNWLTVYAFSTENWKRSTEEVLGLMKIFRRYIEREAEGMSAEGVRLRFIGGRERLDKRLRQLMAGISVSNSICFAPDGRTAYFADTPEGRIWRQPLDAEGWPSGERALFADPGASGLRPDGSVTDAEGTLWNAAWGAGKVTRYGADGQPGLEVTLAGSQSTCPAFGGPEFRTMFVTTAREGLTAPDAGQGCVYAIDLPCVGRPEPRVLLP